MTEPRADAPETRRRKGVPPASSDAVRKRMRSTGQRDTPPELAIRKRLFARGLRYRVDHPVLEHPRRRGDIVFPSLELVVFVDGCFWHGCPVHGTWPKANANFWRRKIEANRARDRDTDERLRQRGWVVLRVWEHESPDVAAERILRAVEQRKRALRSNADSSQAAAREKGGGRA